VIPPKFESAQPFSEGLAAVELNGRFGYIDREGRFAIALKYSYAGPFSDGFAWVRTHNPWAPLGTGEYGFLLLARYTFIDHSGKEIIHPLSVEYVGSFSEGLAAVRPGKTFGGCDRELGYMNTDGKWAIKPEFDDGRPFSDGLAAVNRGGKCHMGGKWGYIDRDGKLVIPFQYSLAGQFRDGYACVLRGKQWQRIDTTGRPTAIGVEKCRQ
jgi:hypothetical protein